MEAEGGWCLWGKYHKEAGVADRRAELEWLVGAEFVEMVGVSRPEACKPQKDHSVLLNCGGKFRVVGSDLRMKDPLLHGEKSESRAG